jgi:hypothetical protein
MDSSTAVNVAAHGMATDLVHCNPGDYATGGGANAGGAAIDLSAAVRFDFNSQSYSTLSNGQTPNAWEAGANNPSSVDVGMYAEVICQTPLTVAGIGVPEFGSLYVAIALGAVVYFVMSRRLARRPTMSAIVNA